ncbi:MAG: ABC transporter permease [Bacteroidales bacterium]|nr:ABC transporter permease [Bacteroidales bacterium]
MIKNFFINAFRNMRKQRGYLLLNIGGLAIGLTSFLFITLYVMHELSYDRFHNNYENIYRVKVVGVLSGGVLDQAVTCAPMAHALVSDYPEILISTRVTRMGAWLIQFGENRFNEDGLLFADSTFFKVFDFKLLKGDPNTALERPKSMILTEKYAKKYFGNQDPMGKQMIVEADSILYTVTGIVQDVPDNSHIKFDMLASMSTFPGQANNQIWLSNNIYTYFVAVDGTSKDVLQAKLGGLVTKYVGPQVKQLIGVSFEDFKKSGNDYGFAIEPLKDIHLKGAPQYNLEPMGSLTTVYIFSVIAILILVIAIINYINLATAKSVNRAREVGVRKVAGASKTGLISQFLGESLLITGFAAVLALLLVVILMPSFNNMIGIDLSTGPLNTLSGIFLLIVLVLLVAILAGFYPAFVLASFNPVQVLKGTLNPGSISSKLRALLVVFQFTVSIVIIIGSIIVYNQLNFMTKKDIGFMKDNLIIIRRSDAIYKKYEAFRDQLLQIPGIGNVGFSRAVPGTEFNYNAFFNDDDPEKKTYLLNQTQVSFDFPQALGVQLLEGRFYSREYGSDTTSVLINEAAVKCLGLKDPVGKYILQPRGPQEYQKLKIIGIMKDFNIESMHKAITPVCFTVLYPGGGDQYAAIRLTGSDNTASIRAIAEKWQSYTTKQPFQFNFFSETWNHLYASEIKTGKIFILFSVLAILIACLGLLGLITYITNKRTKEIGIRKTYGASIGIVLGLLSKEVVYLILFSSLIAYPAAWFGSKYWLQGFADKVKVSPLIFVLATMIALLIGLLAISYQTIKAANYNPSRALRIE